jgi:hypothetical protein
VNYLTHMYAMLVSNHDTQEALVSCVDAVRATGIAATTHKPRMGYFFPPTHPIFRKAGAA